MNRSLPPLIRVDDLGTGNGLRLEAAETLLHRWSTDPTARLPITTVRQTGYELEKLFVAIDPVVLTELPRVQVHDLPMGLRILAEVLDAEPDEAETLEDWGTRWCERILDEPLVCAHVTGESGHMVLGPPGDLWEYRYDPDHRLTAPPTRITNPPTTTTTETP